MCVSLQKCIQWKNTQHIDTKVIKRTHTETRGKQTILSSITFTMLKEEKIREQKENNNKKKLKKKSTNKQKHHKNGVFVLMIKQEEEELDQSMAKQVCLMHTCASKVEFLFDK